MTQVQEEFYLFAHRGASGYAPENTLLAFSKALELGAPWIELDVYAIERELIVFHDERLEYKTNGVGPVADASLAYIRSLDAGEGERIPLLAEVLDLIGGSAGLNIELKGQRTAAPVALLLKQTLRDTKWEEDQFIVSSFNHPELLAFSGVMPEVRIGVLTKSIPQGYAAFAEAMDAWSVHANLEFLNREFVEDAHARGMKMFVYTVNERDDFARMIELGVDGVFTDYPDRLRASE
jgi:glycerophosphoryl diester phosphodiesterase